MSSVPGWGRSPEGGRNNLLQYSCLENPMDRGTWRATIHRVTQSQTGLEPLNMHTKFLFYLFFFIFFKVIVLIHWFCCCFYRKYHDFQVLHQLRSLIVTALVFAPFLLFFAADLLIHTLLKRCLENISSDNLITVAYNLISPDHIGL